MSISVHYVCTYSAGNYSEHGTSSPTFFFSVNYSYFEGMNMHSLPQQIAAAAVYHFL